MEQRALDRRGHIYLGVGVPSKECGGSPAVRPVRWSIPIWLAPLFDRGVFYTKASTSLAGRPKDAPAAASRAYHHGRRTHGVYTEVYQWATHHSSSLFISAKEASKPWSWDVKRLRDQKQLDLVAYPLFPAYISPTGSKVQEKSRACSAAHVGALLQLQNTVAAAIPRDKIL
jgi:hypothetical protein